MIKRIEHKKKKRQQIFMGLFLAFLMVASMMGVFIGNSGSENIEYNNFKFSQGENGYVTVINGETYGFSYLPQELEYFNVSSETFIKTRNPYLYTTFDSNISSEQLQFLDVVRMDLQQSLKSNIMSGMTMNSTVYNLQIINCENSTDYIPVIYFKYSNKTSIEDNNNCIILSGQTYDFFKLRDWLVYAHHGVMNG